MQSAKSFDNKYLASLSQSTMNETQMETYLDRTLSPIQKTPGCIENQSHLKSPEKLKFRLNTGLKFTGNISEIFNEDSVNESYYNKRVTNTTVKEDDADIKKKNSSKQIFNSILKVGKKIFGKVSKHPKQKTEK